MRDIKPRETPCYCMNFRRMAGALTKFYDAALSPAGLTANQLSLLTDIHTIQPCSRSELARCARLDRTTVIRNLDLLIKKGYVAQQPEEHNRYAAIRLTPAGEDAMQQGFLLWKQAQSKVKEVFAPETRAVLREAFSKVGEIEALLDEPSGGTT